MTIDIAILVLIVVVNLIIGLLVFLHEPKNRINRLFTLMVSLLIIWMTFNFLQTLPYKEKTISIFINSDFALASILSYIFLLFCFIFPKPIIISQFKKFLLFVFPFTFFILSLFTNLIVDHLEYSGEALRGYNAIPGKLYLFYILFLVGYLIAGCGILAKKYTRSKGIEKRQIFYIFSGLFLTIVIALIVNLLFPRFENIPTYLFRFGVYGSFCFVSFTAYAIVKHHLFNIRVVATEVFTGLIILVFLVQTLLSENVAQFLLRLGMLILVIFFGALLIRSILQEIKRREQIQALAESLEKKTQELKQANIYLKQLMKMKTEFLTIASHQLRTPASIIRGYLSMLIEGEVPEEKKDEYIKTAYEGSNRLEQLIHDLLSATELEAGKIELNLKEQT